MFLKLVMETNVCNVALWQSELVWHWRVFLFCFVFSFQAFLLPSCEISVTRKVVQVYRKWILQHQPVFMEEPDKKDVAQEDADKLRLSETDSKEVTLSLSPLSWGYIPLGKVDLLGQGSHSAHKHRREHDILRLLGSVQTCLRSILHALSLVGSCFLHP